MKKLAGDSVANGNWGMLQCTFLWDTMSLAKPMSKCWHLAQTLHWSGLQHFLVSDLTWSCNIVPDWDVCVDHLHGACPLLHVHLSSYFLLSSHSGQVQISAHKSVIVPSSQSRLMPALMVICFSRDHQIELSINRKLPWSRCKCIVHCMLKDRCSHVLPFKVILCSWTLAFQPCRTRENPLQHEC